MNESCGMLHVSLQRFGQVQHMQLLPDRKYNFAGFTLLPTCQEHLCGIFKEENPPLTPVYHHVDHVGLCSGCFICSNTFPLTRTHHRARRAAGAAGVT